MGDHFVLLVDRLLTESTLEAAIESRLRSLQATASGVDDDLEVEKSSKNVDFDDISTPRKMVECRICQDDDVDSNMETPCSCCGSLKYAHRRCIQKWCNEKGNTICEICQQPFKPGYTAPPPLFHFGRIPINLSDILQIMILLLLRHTLPILLSESVHISFPLMLLILLRVTGIVLPIYVMVKSLTAIQQRRQQQEVPSSDDEPEEAEHESALQVESHIINVH
ncbi:Probable E3 ubiquitin ligase SUD1 [Linum perenne]